MLPKGITSSGFPAVQATCRKLGLEFDGWQVDLNRCILGKSRSGYYAADTVAMSIPRQVGKTWDIGALVFALCIINPGTTVVWTAHRFKVARETFDSLKNVATLSTMAPHIDPDKITTAAGNEQIPFRNGSRLIFAARERGAIRGFSKVGILVLDEAQILSEHALADLAPTMNQAANPLILLMGTPPKPTDPGEVFRRLRSEALDGDSEDVLYVEFSAKAGSDPDDREAWREANPSYPKRTPARSIQRLKKLLSAEDFLREALGIWDEDGYTGPFSPGAWPACATTTEPPAVKCLGLALDVDRVWLSLAAGSSGTRKAMGAVLRVRYDHAGGQLLAELARIARERDVPVAIDKRGPAGSLIEDVESLGVEVVGAGLEDYVQACADVFDAVEAKELNHGDDPDLNRAVLAAGWRYVGDRRVWSRKAGDISMLEAGTLAVWGAAQSSDFNIW